MCIFGGAEDRGGFLRAIDFVYLRELHHRESRAAFICECDVGARLQRARGIFIDAQRDRKRPRRARCEPHLIATARVISLAHETGQRRERSRGEHLKVGQLSRAEFNGGKFFRVGFQRRALRGGSFQIVEIAAAMGRDWIIRDRGHWGLPAGLM